MARPYAICAVLWAVLMFIGATAKSQPSVCLLFPQEDKVIHFVEYAIFAFLLYRMFIHSSKTRVITMAAAYTAIVAVAYGGALELYQAFLPYRECSALDFMANCAGVAFTLGLCWRPRG
ncbi:MAG: VanZ family protein [Chlamydiota bacterium]